MYPQPPPPGWMGPPPPPLPPPVPVPSQQTHLWVLGAVAMGMFLCVALATGIVLYQGGIQRTLLAIEPRCTVGVTGTAATLTIEGWSANQDCQDIVAGNPSFLGTAQPGTYYLYTSTPTNPEVCEVDVQGRHLIVRDEGVLKLVGNALCAALEQSSSAASSSQLVGVVPTATATLSPTATPTPVPLPSTTNRWSTSGDTSTGWGFTVQPPSWSLTWTCVTEQDPNGSLAIRFVWESGQVLWDSGVKPCTGQSYTLPFTVRSSGSMTVELCENADFTTTPHPSGPNTIDCASGAVRWTISSPTPSTGNVGWS